MHDETEHIIERPDDLTAAWLTQAIGAGAVADFAVERIGTGQMSECYRVRLTYADAPAYHQAATPASSRPETVVLKVAASDPTSRQTGLALGLYEREVRFYRDIAPRLGGPLAPCYHAAINTSTGAFDLLLGDAGPAAVGDELAGATVEQAHLGAAELARLQGPLLRDGSLAETPWLNREAPVSQTMLAALYAGFLDRYGDQIAPRHRMVCERLVAAFDGYQALDDQAQGLVHGDYRLDNLLFGAADADRPLTVVDWQTVARGPAMTDLSYFLGIALPAPQRREHYDALLRSYHETLGPGAPVTLADVTEGVRRQSFFGVMMAIVSSMLVERTERGDRLFLTMMDRHCSHVLDTGALEVLPTPSDLAALQPDPADEAAHTPGDEPLWNESWYWDFADEKQGVGGWIRLGLIPNQKVAWINALVCGPDIDTVALLDFHAPLPRNPNDIDSGGIRMVHSATVPLRQYRVAVEGPARSFTDPAGLLHGEAGEPAHLAMDLTWNTGGIPFEYRIATRYEIPCTVSGSITIGSQTFSFDAVPGQRDHSHGVRDWWSMDWVWSALHLQDGTHLHGVDLRLPDLPPVSVGYIQPPGQPVIETTSVSTVAVLADNGLPLGTTLNFEPGGISADVEVLGNAPVRLVSPDGRVSFFPRAWVKVSTTDGRSGVGWIEWNRNQAASD